MFPPRYPLSGGLQAWLWSLTWPRHTTGPRTLSTTALVWRTRSQRLCCSRPLGWFTYSLPRRALTCRVSFIITANQPNANYVIFLMICAQTICGYVLATSCALYWVPLTKTAKPLTSTSLVRAPDASSRHNPLWLLWRRRQRFSATFTDNSVTFCSFSQGLTTPASYNPRISTVSYAHDIAMFDALLSFFLFADMAFLAIAAEISSCAPMCLMETGWTADRTNWKQ
jgi:hypothetical protein